jgi:hypothetical protein
MNNKKVHFGKVCLGLIILAIVASLSFSQQQRTAIETMVQECEIPLQSCKNPHYIGKSGGNCTCFSCEDPDKNHLAMTCTSNDHTKVSLFESEAAQRETEVKISKFHQALQDRIVSLVGARAR